MACKLNLYRKRRNTDMSYQGWTNYETWAVSLWLDNDKGLYHEVPLSNS